MRISDWSSDVCSSDLLAKHFPDLGGLIGNRPERRKAALRQSSMLSSRLSVEALEPRLLLSADVPPVGVSDTPDPMETIFGEFTLGRPEISLASDAQATAGAGVAVQVRGDMSVRSEEHTSELQSLMRTSYAV